VTARLRHAATIADQIAQEGTSLAVRLHANGVVVGEKTFDGRQVKYLRDARDYIVGIVDALGKTTIERNKVGQVVAIVGPDGAAKQFEYDGRGALSTARSNGVTLTWTRDADGEIARESTAFAGVTHFVETARDLMGRRIGTTTSAGHFVEVKRDAAGDPTGWRSCGSRVTRWVSPCVVTSQVAARSSTSATAQDGSRIDSSSQLGIRAIGVVPTSPSASGRAGTRWTKPSRTAPWMSSSA
jgi:YD repeat-containing protein